MNRQAQELLAKINAKVAEVKLLAATGDLAKTRAAKKELDDLQAMFECVKDLDDEAGAAVIENGIRVENTKTTDKARKEKAFVNVLVAGIRRTDANPEDVKIYNTMTEGTSNGEDGGLTVPQDICTEIRELRRDVDDLEQYIDREPVSTNKGSRTIEKDAETTPWDNVDEAAAFPEESTPQFELLEYKVTKKGGILTVTEELLSDTAENIMKYLKKYIAKKTKATRNAFILKVFKDAVGFGTEDSEVKTINGIDGLKKTFNSDLEAAIRANAKVLTNRDGFAYLDGLKDEDGNYILQPDPTKATQKILFGKYPIVEVSNKTLATREIKDSQSEITGYAYPVILGDLKESAVLFDREFMTIEISKTAGDLWKTDKTGIKIRDRFDVKRVDKKAFVFGEMVESVSTGA